MTSFRALLDRYDPDGLLRHSVVVMVFTHMASVANLLFHVVMGRMLGKAEYGVLSSMLGMILIVATPMLALQNTLAHYAARLKQEGREGAMISLAGRWYRTLAWPAVAILVVGVLLRQPLTAFFHLESSLPIVLAAGTLSFALFLPVIPGVFQGLQGFIWMCLSLNLWGVVRLLLGALLVVLFGPLAIYGIGAQWVGALVSVCVGWLGLCWIMRGKPRDTCPPIQAGGYFFKSFAALGFFGILMNADVVMVKHFFEPVAAGSFAQAATIGRMVVFLCQPIAVALFPKVVSGGAMTVEQRKTLLRGMGISVLLVVSVAAAISLVPALPLRLLYGEKEPTLEQLRLVRIVVWAMSPLVLSFILLNFEMAQRRFRMLVPLGISAVIYVIGVTFWHQRLACVAIVLGGVAVLSVAGLIGSLPWRIKREDGIEADG